MSDGAGGPADRASSRRRTVQDSDGPVSQELPTPEERRWALLAAQLPFDQLMHARAQAEGWRNGLAAATGVIATVTLVRGRTDLTPLATSWKVLIVTGLTAAFASLVAAFLVAIRAAHGRPGLMIQADGECLRKYIADESRRIMQLLPWAAYLSVIGVTLVLATAVLTWLAPSGGPG